MLSTTELLVEHIISGTLSLIWVLAFVFCFIDFDWKLVAFVQANWVVLVVFITALAYPLGIIVDTAADRLLKRKEKEIKDKNISNPNVNILMLIQKAKDANITNYFTYNRFKSRIARSSALNFFLIGLFLPAFVLCNDTVLNSSQPTGISLVLFVFFLMLTLASLFVWYDSTKTIASRANSLWEALETGGKISKAD